MRKTTKGAIAVGAGVALLLGGAGTLAYWTDTNDVDSNTTVTAGNLDLAPVAATAAWTWKTGGQTFVPATSRIVPGDVVVFTQRYTVTAQGDRLKAQLLVNGAPAKTANTPTNPANVLDDKLVLTPLISVVGALPPGVVVSATNDSLTVTNPGATAVTFQVDVKVEVDFPFGTADAQNGTTQSVNLAKTTIPLNQTA